MGYSSYLNNNHEPLVLDTSVLINLRASMNGGRVLAAVPNKIIVPQIVAGELNHEVSSKNGDNLFLHNLISDGIINVTDLTDEEYIIFQQLTCVSPSLDDGEAATISIAVARQLIPVIDERKGRARAGVLMNGREPLWSLDILRHPSVISALGDQAIKALYLALRDGRMRIPTATTDFVISLIGVERAKDCTCLPGYRERFSVNEMDRNFSES